VSSNIQRFTLRFAVEGWRGPPRELYGPGHALFLGLLRRADPVAAKAIHDANHRKPFALSPLRIDSSAGAVAPAALSVSSWNPSITRLLSTALGQALELQVAVCARPALLVDVTPSAPIGVRDLATSVGGGPVEVRFLSPTFFSIGRRNGHQRYSLLPEAELVVRSWLHAWTEAGGSVPNESWTIPGWLGDRVAVRHIVGLSTVVVDAPKTALTGFTGHVAYSWTSPEPWGLDLLAALARFAEYCGTGAKTGFGFGQTRCAHSDARGRDAV
jgi:CRISPR-associated endoribonuclease Cas6